MRREEKEKPPDGRKKRDCTEGKAWRQWGDLGNRLIANVGPKGLGKSPLGEEWALQLGFLFFWRKRRSLQKRLGRGLKGRIEGSGRSKKEVNGVLSGGLRRAGKGQF